MLGCELSKYISKSRFTVILNEIWSKSRTSQNKSILGCELSEYMSKSRFTVILNEIWSKSKTSQF